MIMLGHTVSAPLIWTDRMADQAAQQALLSTHIQEEIQLGAELKHGYSPLSRSNSSRSVVCSRRQHSIMMQLCHLLHLSAGAAVCSDRIHVVPLIAQG